MSDPLRVVLGYDKTEISGVYSCIDSILKHATRPVSFTLLNQNTLRSDNLYWVEKGKDEATEFSRTRFLAPYLAGYKGQVAFLDGADMIVRGDITELFSYCPPGTDCAVVKHEYVPKAHTKFGTTGTPQRAYKRKLWSSVIVFNAYTNACQRLTPRYVNEATGAELHQFAWIPTRNNDTIKALVAQDDTEIIKRRVAEIPEEWNWIPNHSEDRIPMDEAKLIHFTEGGVWHEGHTKTPVDEVWLEHYRAITTKVAS